MYKKMKYFKDYFKAHQSLKWRVLALKCRDKITLSINKDKLIEIDGLLIRTNESEFIETVPIATCNSEEEAQNIMKELNTLPNTVVRLYNKNVINDISPFRWSPIENLNKIASRSESALLYSIEHKIFYAGGDCV